MTRTLRALAAVALGAITLASASCAVSEDQEVELGREYAAQIARELRFVQDPAVTAYVERLGRDIAARTERSDLPWTFHVVDAAEVNAFAVPGGFIYINRGLIERAERMDELAGVLGHEIGHVVLRHSAEQMEKKGKATGVLTAVCLLTGLCDGAVAQVAINVAGAAWFAKHSRADEAEADSAGIHAVMRVGIDPRGIPSFFETLLEQRRRQPSVFDDWFSSHPLEEDRVRRTQVLIGRLPADRLDRLARDGTGFQQMKARLRALPPSTQAAPRLTPEGQ